MQLEQSKQRRKGKKRKTRSRVFYGQGNDFNNLSSEDAGALGFLDAIFSSLHNRVSSVADILKLIRQNVQRQLPSRAQNDGGKQ